MMHEFGVMRSPCAIIFGCGQRYSLGRITRAFGQRVLICTDNRLATDPLFSSLLESLHAAGVDSRVYSDTLAELPLDGVYKCGDFARSFRPDVIVGIGGGSCMDMAKMVSLLLTHNSPLDRYYGEMRVPGPVLPVIAIPTTSGTGSEVTPVAVLADSQRDLKVGVSSPYLIPHTAICDPELTVSCPPQLTAFSGADALTHAIEAFTAIRREPVPGLAEELVFVGKNVISDLHALSAIRAIATHLPQAFADGSDRDARAGMMLGALHAGLAFGTAGTAAAHAIQYPIGALTHTAHAIGVALLMPYVMAYNRPACTAEFAQIALAMGATDSGEENLADRAIVKVADLLESIGIPRTLAELQLDENSLGWVARQSMLSARLVNNNPRPLDEEAAGAILAAALAGDRPWSNASNKS
ncbi:MAG: iron-containing alcohol dehydrogenase [Pigmentiphaga sp.]